MLFHDFGEWGSTRKPRLIPTGVDILVIPCRLLIC